jgi:aminoglycoside phosphotransferase (APT) family kinase protein
VSVEEGTDHVAFEKDGTIVRFSKEEDPAVRAREVRREAAILAAVKEVATVPTPVPVLCQPDEGFLAYPKVPGIPLAQLPLPWRIPPGFGARLGDFLARLHAFPLDRARRIVEYDVWPLSEWLAAAVQEFAAVAHHVPEAHHGAIERFLAAATPAEPHEFVFCHNDLGIEHILVDPETREITGVIDWADAAIADPAIDFARLYRDLGPSILDAFRADAMSVERARFYGRCTVFEDLAYGLDTGRHVYVDNSLAALEWLFPA